jgi:hypothetical protein
MHEAGFGDIYNQTALTYKNPAFQRHQPHHVLRLELDLM